MRRSPRRVLARSTVPTRVARPVGPTDHVDVLVVGAGISGIGAAWHLLTETRRSFAVVEARHEIGGTWDLFRYPGVRSDSDLYTFGFDFRPWEDDDAIASGEKIRDYLHATVADEGLRPFMQFHSRVVRAEWSTPDARWTVTVEDSRTGEVRVQTAGWIFAGTGYYRYEEGFTPNFTGLDAFTGQVIHPQHWPEDVTAESLAGKKVLVIGSGATAVTLVPALADGGAEVTMLQRTPTYVMPLPARDGFGVAAKKLLGVERGTVVTRYKSALVQRLSWAACRRWPAQAKKAIRAAQRKVAGDDVVLSPHFDPPYDPWDQRLCVAPDGDFFTTLREGRARVVTDEVDAFTRTGVRTKGGEHLEADVVVTATGFTVQPFGAIETLVDGEKFELTDHVAYRGLMLDGLPNFAFSIGYTNASWTLKVGLLCDYFVDLLRHMEVGGFDWVRPDLPADDGPDAVGRRPLLDFGAGYVQRSLDALPSQGDRAPWLMTMNWFADRRLLRRGDVDDSNLTFGRRASGGQV
ncbi:flavin-containing monooxygenase [Nocardioides yefusunii]|uniref:Flavin-containing monooxygenase n=1 Tax=Nocardioides yefusunii TaxID=2500546 RepID=A0ABW1R2D6_9ACTN|nr:NAD(P)/FAD-dependent oxidoreductase [Nocardioides yefusunii]